MVRVYEKLGLQVLPKELADIRLDNTPQFKHKKQKFHKLAE